MKIDINGVDNGNRNSIPSENKPLIDENLVNYIYTELSNAIPEAVTLHEALRGALRLVADIIQQGGNSDFVLEVSKKILDCEYAMFKKQFGSNNKSTEE